VKHRHLDECIDGGTLQVLGEVETSRQFCLVRVCTPVPTGVGLGALGLVIKISTL